MKRTELVLACLFAFLFLVFITTNQSKFATANFLTGFPLEPAPIGVTLETPTNGTTYLSDDISLVISINVTLGDVRPDSVVYILDGQETSVPLDSFYGNKPYLATLTGLSDGWHSLSAKATGYSYYDTDPSETHWNIKRKIVTDSKSIMFFVDAAPPSIEVFSPRSENYTSADVTLNFTVSKSVEFITYSLDGKNNVTITGNTTITGLPNGAHNITLYANGTNGNIGTSETIHFSITAPFPTILTLTASGVTVTVIATGLLFYFKKHKHADLPDKAK